jgi:hypothetical protein
MNIRHRRRNTLRYFQFEYVYVEKLFSIYEAPTRFFFMFFFNINFFIFGAFSRSRRRAWVG